MSATENPENPPGYGEVIGGVVLYDPPAEVIEAACDAFFSDPEATWADAVRKGPALADEMRTRMRASIRAAITASSSLPPLPTAEETR